MSLTKAQTAAVDTLLDYLAETVRPGHTSPPKHAEAHNALVLLAVAAGHDGNDADGRLAATWRDRLNVQRDLADLEGKTRAIRSHIRVHQAILGDRQRENPQSVHVTAKLQILDQIAACLDHMHDEPPAAAAPDRANEEDAVYWAAAADWEQRTAAPDRPQEVSDASPAAG